MLNSHPNPKVSLMPVRNVNVLAVCLLLIGLVPTAGRAAGPVYWDWPTERQFSELELSGTALDQDGYLVAGLNARTIGPDGPEVFWQAVSDGHGGFYAATGHGGEVHHTDSKGQSRLVASLDATEVFSLLVLADGDLLAGCGPEGRVYRLTDAGESRIVGTVAGGYVWSMVQAASDGVVWLATGSPGAVYRYDPAGGQFAVSQELPVENIMDVRVAVGGGVLAATQGPGLVYRIVPGQPLRLLFEAPQDEARAFVEGPDGEVFLLALQTGDKAGSSGTGRTTGSQPESMPSLLAVLGAAEVPETAPAALYRLADDGRVSLWWSGKRELMTAAWSPRWGWLGAGEVSSDDGQAEVRRLSPPRGSQPLARWPGGDILNMMVPDSGADQVLVCQTHPGMMSALAEHKGLPRVAVSTPLDGGQPVRWSRLNWTGSGGRGHLKWSVRGGNRSEPDETWTAWSDSWSETDHALALPLCRYMQWRVEFPARGDDETGWRVTAVSASAWQDNQPPVIVSFQQEFLQDVSLGGLVSGQENITQRFASGLQAEFSRSMAPDKWAGPDRGTLGRSVRVFTWQATDPNGDRLTYRLEYRRKGEGSWRPLPTSRPGVWETTETLSSWDTATVADGSYQLRLIASDGLDNPLALAGRTERLLGPLLVDNTPPAVTDFAVKATANGFAVHCRVSDQASVVAGARLRLPDGTFERLDPVDRVCDSRTEQFATEVAWPRPGILAGSQPWQVQLEVRDLAGNLQAVEAQVQ